MSHESVIVENGSIVANANSYVSRADYVTYADSMGVNVDAGSADSELIQAALFIDQHDRNLKGARVSRDQSMAFPRTGVEIDGWYWAHTEIPRNVILCQMQLAIDIHNGFDPWNPATNPNLAKKKKRVEGAVEVQYAVSDNSGQKLSRTSRADALLKSLLVRSGLSLVKVVRG